MSPNARSVAISSRFLVVCFCAILVLFFEADAKNVNKAQIFRAKRTADDLDSTCENVRPFLESRNISFVSIKAANKGNICSGQCCDDKTESQLRTQGQSDFASLLRHNSRSLQGLLSSTSSSLQTHVTSLAHQSRNKTMELFSKIYHRMSVFSRDPIETLYADVRNYVLINTSSHRRIDIKESTERFFSDLFPLVYMRELSDSNSKKDFTTEYKSCLKRHIGVIQPFGEVPKQIIDGLSKSLEATRLLFQAFNVGLEVLNSTDSILMNSDHTQNAACHDALVKMTYCPRCQGFIRHAKPCKDYCLNVLRGCLTRYVTELDSPWNGYVDSLEKLIGGMRQHGYDSTIITADEAIRGLGDKISEAIMFAMNKGKEIDPKVKKYCGLPVFSDKENPQMTEPTIVSISAGSSGKVRYSARSTSTSLSPPETQLHQFLTSISKSKGFYGNLADTLCLDESFAEQNDHSCWNGERIAQYTKEVLLATIDNQKYNPEVKQEPNTKQNSDPRIADLADKLRHVHHLVMTSLGSTFENEIEDYQRDSGVDGSGSGNGDGDDDDDDMRGSGSGDGAHGRDGSPKVYTDSNYPSVNIKPHSEDVPTVIPSSGSKISISLLAVFVATLLLQRH